MLKRLSEPGSILIGLVLGIGCTTAVILFLFPSPNFEDDSDESSRYLNQEEASEIHDERNYKGSNRRVALPHFFLPPSKESQFSKKTTVFRLLQSAEETELARHWTQVGSIQHSPWKQFLQTSMIRRFTALNPQNAVAFVKQNREPTKTVLLKSVFQDLSISDVSIALQVGSSLDFPLRKMALDIIWDTRTDLSTKELLSVGVQLGLGSIARREQDMEQTVGSVKNPEEAWENLLQSGKDLVPYLNGFVDVARAWVENDGVQALKKVVESTTTMVNGDLFRRALVKSVDKSNIETLFQSLATEDYSILLSDVAKVWAEIDPLNAYLAASQVKDSSRKLYLRDEVMRIWSHTQPETLLENANLLPRATAQQAISLVLSELARVDPLQAIQKLEELDLNKGLEWRLLNDVVYGWADSDPILALEWVLSQDHQSNPENTYVMQHILSSLVRLDPDRALETAQDYPIFDPVEGHMEAHVIKELLWVDTDKAMEFLPKIKIGAKSQSYQIVGAWMVRKERYKEALELGEELGSGEQTSYYSNIFRVWSQTNANELVDTVDSLGSGNLQNVAARSLLEHNKLNHVLSDDQINFINSFVRN